MAIGTAVVGAVSGAAKFFEGQSMQNRAQEAIDKFRFTELQNPYRDVRVSELGANLQREQASQATAGALDVLRQGGTRAVIGGLPQVTAQNQRLSQQIGAGLDQQRVATDRMAAQQDVRNQELIRQAEAQELAGYGQLLNVGMGMKYGGLGNLANVSGLAGQTKLGQQANTFIEGLFGVGNKEQAPPASQAQVAQQGQGFGGFGGLGSGMGGFNNQLIL